jgi:hypothetical protein
MKVGKNNWRHPRDSWENGFQHHHSIQEMAKSGGFPAFFRANCPEKPCLGQDGFTRTAGRRGIFVPTDAKPNLKRRR